MNKVTRGGEVNFQEMPLGYDLPFSLLNHSVAFIFRVHCSNLVATVLIWCYFIGTVLQTKFLKQENCQQRLVTSEVLLYSHRQKMIIYLNNFPTKWLLSSK